MKPIDKLRAWLEAHMCAGDDKLVALYTIPIGGLRSILAEHDRLTAELAQAKLIGAAEEREYQAKLYEDDADIIERVAEPGSFSAEARRAKAKQHRERAAELRQKAGANG